MFRGQSHEQSAADKPHPASDDYDILDTQTQGQQPHYDVIQLGQRNTQRHNARHQSHNYENAPAAAAAAAEDGYDSLNTQTLRERSQYAALHR